MASYGSLLTQNGKPFRNLGFIFFKIRCKVNIAHCFFGKGREHTPKRLCFGKFQDSVISSLVGSIAKHVYSR